MGTISQKFVTNNAGQLTEVASIKTSAGAADADKVVATNANGVIDPTLVNAKNTSSGASDAGKIAQLNASGVLDDTILNASVTSSANKIAKLDAAGKLDLTVMPTGVGPDTAIITASEALAAGDLVNIWNNGGTANVRKADASTSGKEAHGFVLSAFASAASATVYFEGSNTQCTGLTPGRQYLSDSTPGKSALAAPTGTGKTVQIVGFAISATTLNFQSEPSVLLA